MNLPEIERLKIVMKKKRKKRGGTVEDMLVTGIELILQLFWFGFRLGYRSLHYLLVDLFSVWLR